MIGFTGSRSLAKGFSALVSRVVAGVPGPVAVGCASGADAFVRAAAGSRARVFRVASFRRPDVSFSVSLVARSVALVRAVAASPSPSLVGFVVGPCPSAVSPSASPSACFCGAGSGTWASLALAVGLGVPVFVFWCGSGAPALPFWGSWSRVASGPLAGAWSLSPAPAPAQLSLF
jgi:hypothetical protein